MREGVQAWTVVWLDDGSEITVSGARLFFTQGNGYFAVLKHATRDAYDIEPHTVAKYGFRNIIKTDSGRK